MENDEGGFGDSALHIGFNGCTWYRNHTITIDENGQSFGTHVSIKAR